ncbi:MAG: hypothetical protein ABIJ39_01655 [Chloroflexota bacterium]
MKPTITLFLFAILFTACVPQATELPVISQPTRADLPVTNKPDQPEPTAGLPGYMPQPIDAGLSRGNIYIDAVQVIVMESYPVQILLNLQGNLPTPCNHLRVDVAIPDDQNRIVVDAYSVHSETEMCIQVLEPFDASIPLGSFPPGHYTIWVNDSQAGQFDS